MSQIRTPQAIEDIDAGKHTKIVYQIDEILHGLLKVWTEGYSEHSQNSGDELGIFVL